MKNFEITISNNVKLKDIRVFVCVPAVGKTYLCKHDDRFVDFDRMKAQYKYDQYQLSDRELEFLKGNRGEPKRLDSKDYIEKQLLFYLNNTDKILLFAPNPKIVELICQHNIPYCLVFHSKDCVEEIRKRMQNRGNQENFINSMLDPINEFYKNSVEDERHSVKIELHQGQYLSDVLWEIFPKNLKTKTF